MESRATVRPLGILAFFPVSLWSIALVSWVNFAIGGCRFFVDENGVDVVGIVGLVICWAAFSEALEDALASLATTLDSGYFLLVMDLLFVLLFLEDSFVFLFAVCSFFEEVFRFFRLRMASAPRSELETANRGDDCG